MKKIDLKKASIIVLSLSTVGAPLIAHAGRGGGGWVAPPGSNYCFLDYDAAPSCNAYNACTSINTDPGQQPSDCGQSGTTYNPGSTTINLDNKAENFSGSIASEAIAWRINCSTVQQAPLTCAQDVGGAYDAIRQVLVPQIGPDGKPVLLNGKPVMVSIIQHRLARGALISSVTPLAWQQSRDTSDTGTAASEIVKLDVKPFSFPIPYQFSANVSWTNGDSAPQISFNSQYFQHTATLVSNNGNEADYEVTSTLSPANSPTASATAVSLSQDQLMIEDSQIASLLQIGPQMQTSYIITISTDQLQPGSGLSSSSTQKVPDGTIYQNTIQNTGNQTTMVINLKDKLSPTFQYNPQLAYKIHVDIQTQRTGNPYLLSSPSDNGQQEFNEAKGQ